MTLALLALLGCRSHLQPDLPVAAEDPSADYEALLGRIVDERGLVDYDLLRAEREPLDRYVAWLGRDGAIPGGSYRKSHAVYLNAYNAFVLYAVLENGTPDSVMDVSGWLPVTGSGFFLEQSFSLGNEVLSLWELEHERIRGRNMDYRSHAGMNCASRSCPALPTELFTFERVTGQLNDRMRAWVNDSERGVRVEDGEAVFNPIWDWFERDFYEWSGGDSPCRTAAMFARGRLKQQLRDLDSRGCTHRFFEYDWSLNQQRPEASPPSGG